MTFGINQIAASICFFCLATALIGQEAVYVQRATTSGIMSVEYPIKVNQSHVLTFITSNGLYLVRLDSIDAQLVQVPDTKAATYCGYEYSGDTLFGYTLYFTPGMFRINPDLSSS